MNMKTQTAAVLILASVALTAAGGCSTRQDRLPQSRARQTADDTAFAAGAGRAPTPETSHAFARILITQGRDRDALYVLSRLLRDHPRFVPAHNELAGIYARADRLDDAIAALKSGLEQSPRDPVLHNNLGLCHMLREEHEQALEHFTAAVDAMPANPTFRSNRAAALCLTGRVAEAEREYLTVIDKPAARQNLNILQRLRQRSRDGDDSHSRGGVADEDCQSGG